MVLHVAVSFLGNSSGSEPIVIPTEWAGEKLHAVSNLRATSSGSAIEDTSDPGVKTIRYLPNSTVTYAYDLSKDWQGGLRHPYQFHPVVMPEYFEISGENALIFPKVSRDSRVTANFDFHTLPEGWTLATSFGTSQGHQDYCQTLTGAWKEVAGALFAAGDFRVQRINIAGHSAVVAIRGQWTFTDEQAASEIQQVVGIVRHFWRDYNFPYFLVTLKPYDEDHGDSDGSAFTNAFWMYMSRLDSFESQLTTLAHESFHGWNPGRMGRFDNSKEWNWFQEGFTTYYGYKLVYRAGLLPLSNYVDRVNRDFRFYPATEDPYVRGHVIAIWLDGQIRKESKGKKSLA